MMQAIVVFRHFRKRIPRRARIVVGKRKELHPLQYHVEIFLRLAMHMRRTAYLMRRRPIDILVRMPVAGCRSLLRVCGGNRLRPCQSRRCECGGSCSNETSSCHVCFSMQTMTLLCPFPHRLSSRCVGRKRSPSQTYFTSRARRKMRRGVPCLLNRRPRQGRVRRHRDSRLHRRRRTHSRARRGGARRKSPS